MPSRMFCQVLPPSWLRMVQPSSMAPKTRSGSSLHRPRPLTWLMYGGPGNVHDFVSGIDRSCGQSIHVSPRSVLLNTDVGPVPTYMSPVLGCCTNDHVSL